MDNVCRDVVEEPGRRLQPGAVGQARDLPRIVTDDETGDIGVGNKVLLEPFDRGAIQLDEHILRA